MTHVSKHKLSESNLNKLFKQLSDTISKVDRSLSEKFLEELLGPEEKIMLAKRLAAIAMCIEGNSPYRIGQLLYMSPSTTERIKLNYEVGKYDHIKKVLTKNQTDYEKFWRSLEIVLRAGLPPRGRGRWKSVFEKL